MIDYSPQFFAGEPISLVEGSLAALEGISTRQDGVKRLIGPLELLGKANKIRTSRDWIARAA